MKSITPFVLLLSVLIGACADGKAASTLQIPDSIEATVAIPDTAVDKSLLVYNNKTSLWTLNGHRYSGYMVVQYQDNTPKEKTGILNGKREGQAAKWYPDGHLKQVANYQNGKLHGEKKRWSSDVSHTLVSQLNYHLGKTHGEQTLWYRTGEIYKKLNLNMGKEQGIQQAFRKNGDMYANYEAREGRIFGLKKAALCYGLEDEDIQYEN
ncbi:MAG: membrane-binding protein [Bacteroidota bacterium]